MRCLVGLAWVVGFGLAGCLATGGPAGAEVIVAIDKSKQRMAVLVDGVEQHVWKVSTGLGGGPRAGTYRPERMERKWASRKYGMSPMPHSIFFHEGYAIHGTIYVSRLGNRASHGCVRLHPANAATLFELVRNQGMASTTIVISNTEIALKPLAPARVDASAEPIRPAQVLPPASEANEIPASTASVPRLPPPASAAPLSPVEEFDE